MFNHLVKTCPRPKVVLLEKVIWLVNQLDPPYEVRAGLGGMTAYPPRAMAVVCILLEAEGKTYREMSAHLAAHKSLLPKIGLPSVPSKSTIAASYQKIPQSYLHKINELILEDAKTDLELDGPSAGDGTGISESRYDRWLDHRTSKDAQRKKWVKLHAVINVKLRLITEFLVTDSNVADIRGMYEMLDKIGPIPGDFCLDSAYLAREMCDRIKNMGGLPLIKPKSNSIPNARGSQAWRDMMEMHDEDKETFDDRYHQRSIIESVFGALKIMYGGNVRCRRPDTIRNEISIKVICYNIELVARAKVKCGALTRESLEALAA